METLRESFRSCGSGATKRVSGFRSSKADDLEAYFLENGHLSEKEPLSEEEMWQWVLADLAQERDEGVVETSDLDRLFDRLPGTGSAVEE